MRFALPFAATSILQQLFNTIDVAVVGRFASSEALAAVGANTFLINLMINLFVGISVGANVIIANHIGQHDRPAIRHAVQTTVVVALVAGLLLLALGEAIAEPVLKAMGTPEVILSDAVLYLRLYLAGAPFFMVYNFGAAILRSKGDTRRPLYILLVAGILNTALNLLFVICFGMGVGGVATATAIANAGAAAAMVVILRREPLPFRLQWRHVSVHQSELRRMLAIGVPAGLQAMVFSLSNIFVQWAINGFGPAAIAGASVAQTFDSYCYFLMSAFCGAAVTFTGQNYGAGLTERCRRIFLICLAFGFGSCFVANMLFFFNARALLLLFTTDGAVVSYALERMRWVIVFQSIAAFYEIPAACMRGRGISLLPALITVAGTCVLRLSWIFLVCPYYPSFRTLMLVYPVSWLLTSIMMMAANRR